MATINPDLVPTIAPGSLFERLTEDSTLSIRFLTSLDPVYFETMNRHVADVALRQLIIAKTLDQLNLQLGARALFPYLTQPKIVSGTSAIDVPLSMIWDMHVSMPAKWENVRLAKIKRVSGSNSAGSDSDESTGKLRLVFTATEQGATVETSVFQADMVIDSDLLYQIVRITKPTSAEETTPIDPGEASTVDGFLIFRLLDQDNAIVDSFLNAVAPPATSTVNSAGEFDSPTIFEIQDSAAGGPTDPEDFSLIAVSHGTGILVVSAWNSIPTQDSNLQTILNTYNYPFDADVTRASVSPGGITIPIGLFKEFNMAAPAGDEPTGDTSGNFFPVWINRIERDDAASDSLSIFFATFNIEVASTVPIEFAKLVLGRNDAENKIIGIVPTDDLFGESGTGQSDFRQEFGRGHVVLSGIWSGSTTTIDDFFDAFLSILDEPAEAVFSAATTRISSYGLSRVPKTVPTIGQAAGLKGSRDGVSDPGSTNRYVVEEDQGEGDQVDFSVAAALDPAKRENTDIERFGQTGALTHRVVKLVVDSSGTSHTYTVDILPRLVILLGRNPKFGDFWWDGTNLKFFNGDTWQT